VVLGGLVGGRRDHGRAVVVGVLDGAPAERRVVERAERLLDDRDLVVGRVDRGQREAVHVGHERVAHAQGYERAVRAGAREAVVVVDLADRVLRLAGAVAVLDVVERVVVVVEEVPARDVVGVAVGVGVVAVREGDQEVLRREHVRRARAARVGLVHAVVAGEVAEVEDVVAVRVVGGRVGGAVDARDQRRARGVGRGQLLGVQARLEAQVLHRAGVVPLDAGVEHGDRHVRAAGCDHPAGLHGVVGVDQVRAADAVQLSGVGGVRAARLGRGGELPVALAVVDVARDDARVQLEGVVGAGRAARCVRVGGKRRLSQRQRGHDPCGYPP
jgi:hypothetical protein